VAAGRGKKVTAREAEAHEEKKMNAECPECAAAVTTQGALKGEILTCAECGAELELMETDPPTLALAPKEEEDWGE
jgi:alpha-aminoadipate carrier protein LysW